MKWESPFRKCWEFPLNVDNSDLVASDNNRNIIFTENNRSIASLNAETGEQNWKSDLGGKLRLDFILDQDSIYSVSTVDFNEDGTIFNLRSIDGLTGVTNWQFEIQTPGKLSILQNAEQLFIIETDGTIKAVRKTDGRSNWIRQLPDNINSALLFTANELFVFTDKQVIGLTTKNGEILTSNLHTQKFNQTIILSEREFISGNSGGEIFLFNVKSKKRLWNARAGGGISGLVKTSEGVLVSSLDNFLYLFTTKNGKLKWRRRVAGRINLQPLIVRNYAVVLNSNNNIAIIIDIRNGKIINQIKIDENDYFSSNPVIANDFLIFRTFKGIFAFSNKICGNKKAGN